MANVRTLIATVVLAASLVFGIDSIRGFATIGPPPPPVTEIFGPGHARWQQERRIETNVGMRDAFALDYVNRIGIPTSMATALAALVLSFLGWPARRVDRGLCIASGLWLVIVFALSIRFGTAYQAGASTGLCLDAGIA